jgi:hypothetical protein
MPVDPGVPQRSYDVRIAQRKIQRPIGSDGGSAPAALTVRTVTLPVVQSSWSSDLIPEGEVLRWYNKTGSTLTITKVWGSVTTPSSSGNILFDLRKNGTASLWTTGSNRPTITQGNYLSSLNAPNVTSLADGDYLILDVLIAGTGAKGAMISIDLTG